MVGGRGNGWTDRPFAINKREMVSYSDGRHRGVGCSSKIRRLRASSMAPPTQDRSYKHRGRCWWRSAGWDDDVGFSISWQKITKNARFDRCSTTTMAKKGRLSGRRFAPKAHTRSDVHSARGLEGGRSNGAVLHIMGWSREAK